VLFLLVMTHDTQAAIEELQTAGLRDPNARALAVQLAGMH